MLSQTKTKMSTLTYKKEIRLTGYVVGQANKKIYKYECRHITTDKRSGS